MPIARDIKSIRDGLRAELPKKMRYTSWGLSVIYPPEGKGTMLRIGLMCQDGKKRYFDFDPMTASYEDIARKMVLLY